MNTLDRLSESTKGKDWLAQFDEIDVLTAALLLDSIQLYSSLEFERGINQLAQDSILANGDQSAFFVSRELETPSPDLLSGHIPKGQLNPSYFDLNNSASKPVRIRSDQDVGSEGILANIVRDICKTQNFNGLDHPSMNEMKESKCRQIVLVDDILGSGKRITDFAKAICNHPTIRSWRSYGLIKITAIGFCASTVALERIKKCHAIDSVKFSLEIQRGRPTWLATERIAIENLCRKYSMRLSGVWKKYPLGYKDSFAMVAFHHKCPNNVPPIVWRFGKNWFPILHSRPSILLPEWPDYASVRARREFAASLWMARNQRNSYRMYWNASEPGAALRLFVLNLLRNRRSLRSIADIIQVSDLDLQEILNELIGMEWITINHRLTSEGVKEVAHSRKLHRERPVRPTLKGDMYFPRMLRENQRLI